MKKTAAVLLLSVVLLFALAGPVSAQSAPPVGTCPIGFEPHTMMDMGGMTDMDHIHAGLKVDLNGDGIICMKVATDGVHVHVDNVITAQ